MQTSNEHQVVFHTNGIIDPMSWEIIGMSAKESDNPIGQFGSGLKFAIAVLLRTEHEITIHTPDNTYNFSTKTKFFRGKEFQIVTCNGKELGITTDMGKFWELWMAYRELVCNTMDEGGLHFSGDKLDSGTSIIVKGEAFHALLERHEDYFVGDREILASVPGRLNVYEGRGSVFYRGVRIGHLENANFAYELFGSIQLTEDRTFANIYEVNREICRYICRIDNTQFIDRFLLCDTKESYESKLEYTYGWSEAFERCCLALWKMSPTKVYRSILVKLRESRPELCMQCKEMTPEQKAFLATAVENLGKLGFPLHGNIQLTSSESRTRAVFTMGSQICITDEFFLEGMFSGMILLFKVWLEEKYPLNQSDFLARELVKSLCHKNKIQL